MKDKNGNPLSVGEAVMVHEEPNGLHNHEFEGIIVAFRGGNVVVQDGDDNVFEVDPNSVEYSK